MPDKYRSVNYLLRHEGRYVTTVARTWRRSCVAVLAIHAGGIEPLTGEIAEAIAGREHRLYEFAGLAPSHNERLHVTSTRFDEPKLRGVQRGACTAISIHGASGDQKLTQIGGLDTALLDQIASALDAAGFHVAEAVDRLAARSPENVVNRVPGGGVQLELSRGLREAMVRGSLSSPDVRGQRRRRTNVFDRYVATIRAVIASELMARSSGRR